jgi:hypothetical protein
MERFSPRTAKNSIINAGLDINNYDFGTEEEEGN